MAYPVNRFVDGVEAPPIVEAMGWVSERARNRPLINLCQAVPSYPPAPELQHHVARMAMAPETGLYTDIAGLPELRAELARRTAITYRGEIGSEDVLITAGCNEAFCLAITALAAPGDNVVLPAPFYFNHQMWLAMQGIEIRSFSSIDGQGAVPDPARARELVDARTRAIVLVTPNNPTGATFPHPTIAAFCELARASGSALVVDETYRDFITGEGPPHRLFEDAGWRDVLVQLYSFSKVYALTGYRVGSVIANAPLIAQIQKIMDCVSICAPRISQNAALFGLRELSPWAAEKRQVMAQRTAALERAFARRELKYSLASAGVYFAYVRHPFTDTAARSVAQRLAREHDLLCLPGSMFGPGQESYLRLAFANVEAEVMGEIAERLIESQLGVASTADVPAESGEPHA
jgi:aspartate/methionine/tyrosine aminotransferase